MSEVEWVPAAAWVARQAGAKAQGSVLLALTGWPGQALRAHGLDRAGSVLTQAMRLDRGGFPSASRALPEVGWDEREIRDLLGYKPVGHPDPRPLVRTPRWPANFFPLDPDGPVATPRFLDREPDNPARVVDGHGVTLMTVGPTHAGVIESGHFVFSLMGENILHLDPHLFQNHRGIEAALAGCDIRTVGPQVTRVCAGDTVSHQTNWAMGVEQLAAYEAPDILRWRRIVLLEAERILSHLNDLAQIPAGVGFLVAHQRALALKESWQQALRRAVGHRFLFDTVRPGGAAPIEGETVAGLVRAFRPGWTAWRRLVEHHHGFQDRMRGVGMVRRAVADRLGAVGVAARAAGLGFDARCVLPLYGDVDLSPPRLTDGDTLARFRIRLDEVEAALHILECVGRRLTGDAPLPMWAPPEDLTGEAVTWTESPRGLNVHVMAVREGRIGRYHIRSGAYRNWPVLARAVAGNAVGDFPLINKSFELCYSCADR